MRGINYLAAAGTILLFIGFFCCKAAFQKHTASHSDGLKKSHQLLLIIIGLAAMAAGVFLVVKAVKKISV